MEAVCGTSFVAQNESDKSQCYLPHVTSKVPMSVHAKFHADWSKTVGPKRTHTDSPSFILQIGIKLWALVGHIQTHNSHFIILICKGRLHEIDKQNKGS